MEARAYKTFTFKVPRYDFSIAFFQVISRVKAFFYSLFDKIKRIKLHTVPTDNLSQLRKPKINFKKILPIALVLITAIATVLWFGKLLTVKTNATADDRVTVAQAKASQNIGREFTFPLKDSTGKKVTNMKLVVDSAELRNEIIVQGKRAIAVQGRTFLILTIKITNDYTKSLSINSRDYFRLTVNGNEADLLAPEIHNDPITVQPTSTKFARLGWPINDSDSRLILSVGEIEGEKTKVELNLK